MFSKRPARRRGATSAAVDCNALLSYIIRRCGTGCASDYYLVVADNFFDNAKFSEEIRDKVCQMLKDRFDRVAVAAPNVPPMVVNGSTVCAKCGRRADLHPLDATQQHLTVLCNGQKIRLST